MYVPGCIHCRSPLRSPGSSFAEKSDCLSGLIFEEKPLSPFFVHKTATEHRKKSGNAACIPLRPAVCIILTALTPDFNAQYIRNGLYIFVQNVQPSARRTAGSTDRSRSDRQLGTRLRHDRHGGELPRFPGNAAREAQAHPLSQGTAPPRAYPSVQLRTP